MTNTPAHIHTQLLLLSASVANKIQELTDRLQRRTPTGPFKNITLSPFPDAWVCDQCKTDALYDAVMETRQILEETMQEIHDEIDSTQPTKRRKRYA
jgi:hypothetical protein